MNENQVDGQQNNQGQQTSGPPGSMLAPINTVPKKDYSSLVYVGAYALFAIALIMVSAGVRRKNSAITVTGILIIAIFVGVFGFYIYAIRAGKNPFVSTPGK
jgi:ABC-type Na+ efflux pump permease subunit